MFGIRNMILGFKKVISSLAGWKYSITTIPLLYTIIFSENFYLLRISLFLIIHILIRWTSTNLLKDIAYLPLELPGLGLSLALIYFIPERIVEMYRWIAISSGTLYKVFEFVQLITITFRFSRYLKERMETASKSTGGLILALSFGFLAMGVFYDIETFYKIQENTHLNELVIATWTFYFILAIQFISLSYQLIKANYDSILLNGASFCCYSAIVGFRLIKRLAALEVAYEKSAFFKKISGLSDILSDLEDFGGLMSIYFWAKILLPILLLATFDLSKQEWKLFMTGELNQENKPQIDSNTQSKGSVLKLILFIVIETSQLLQSGFPLALDIINLFLGNNYIE